MRRMSCDGCWKAFDGARSNPPYRCAERTKTGDYSPTRLPAPKAAIAFALLFEARDGIARFAHVRPQLDIRGPPRVDHELVVGGGLGPAPQSLEDAGPFHGPQHVIEA